MAQIRKTKKGPVPHKVLSDRGEHLDQAHQRQHRSNICAGETVVVDGDTRIEIGQQCPTCKRRVRGHNHVNGDHHKGTVKRHTR